MFVVSQKIQTRKDLQVRRGSRFLIAINNLVFFSHGCLYCSVVVCSVLQDKAKKVKVKKETTSAAAIYKFEVKRKR